MKNTRISCFVHTNAYRRQDYVCKSMCEFLTPEVTYLGHKIGSYGVWPVPGKLSALENFPVPKNVTQILQFLGLAGYYRRFILDFASKVRPLNRLTHKGRSFKWTDEEQKSFQILKDAQCQSPILVCADLNKPFILITYICIKRNYRGHDVSRKSSKWSSNRLHVSQSE